MSKYVDKNKVEIEGNIVADPFAKVVGDYSLTEFTLAVNEYGNKVGFYKIKAWNETAKQAINFSKGNKVIVSGSLAFDSWVDKTDGKKKTSVHIKAAAVQAKTFTPKADKDLTKVDAPAVDPFKTVVNDDDIPF
jgi:single-stranded DNA-binding protein